MEQVIKLLLKKYYSNKSLKKKTKKSNLGISSKKEKKIQKRILVKISKVDDALFKRIVISNH